MNTTPATLDLVDMFTALGRLTPAQQSLFRQIGSHHEPVTVSTLARELSLHTSSIRETLDGLLDSRVVIAQPLAPRGRGRPAVGYTTTLPSDPLFPVYTIHHLSSALFAWLRDAHPDDAEACAYAIGEQWALRAMASLRLTDLSELDELPDGFDLPLHLKEVRGFLRMLGFGAVRVSDSPKALRLLASPLRGGQCPESLVEQITLGLVQTVFRHAVGPFAQWSTVLDQDEAGPTIVITIPPDPGHYRDEENPSLAPAAPPAGQ
ncbi:hypothetical protein M3T53_09495 [Actinomyces sp. B33]|uniref:hypothetical protein n=1 Tax=Actinomyces sp. B33 TaxID=2942131 RepID=UPI002340CC72|nr:hypothetical protein [Actinomyces sp. B33]MDC4233927.1 hypothetical protein [Actinomyces sp. B33]